MKTTASLLIVILLIMILMIAGQPAGNRVPQAGTDNFITVVNGNTGTPWIAIIVSEQSPGGMAKNRR